MDEHYPQQTSIDMGSAATPSTTIDTSSGKFNFTPMSTGAGSVNTAALSSLGVLCMIQWACSLIALACIAGRSTDTVKVDPAEAYLVALNILVFVYTTVLFILYLTAATLLQMIVMRK